MATLTILYGVFNTNSRLTRSVTEVLIYRHSFVSNARNLYTFVAVAAAVEVAQEVVRGRRVGRKWPDDRH
jgi:hypothetical protein